MTQSIGGNPESQRTLARYSAPVLREFGSLTDLTRTISTKTSKPQDSSTKTSNRSG